MSNNDDRTILFNLLDRIMPFRFLSAKEKNGLVSELKEKLYRKGDIIYRKGDSDDVVYIISKGVVETVDEKTDGTETRINVITGGHYFGERSAIFNQNRLSTVRALSDLKCYSLSGKKFRTLLHTSRQFSKAMSNILRDKQGIFSAFDRFKTEVVQGLAREHINIQDLIPFYKAMEPALHSHILDTEKIDFQAFDYAVKRLPCNVTENFIYILIDELYEHYSEPWKLFSPVPAAARRRRGWKMLPGQTMMLYRPGITDLLDLITCLCVFTVEAEKIRRRLSDYKLILMLKKYLDTGDKSRKAEKRLYNYLPFNKAEIEGLKSVWPENTEEQIFKVLIHSGIFSLIIKKQVDLYNTRRSEMWLSQIGDAARKLTGYSPSELPDNIKVHIISSNTHSVLNCLNPDLTESIDSIIEWGRESGHPAFKEEWENRFDLMYALLRDYDSDEDEADEASSGDETSGDDAVSASCQPMLRGDANGGGDKAPTGDKAPGKVSAAAFAADKARAARSKPSEGIITLNRTASTGIKVQLFSLKKLKDKQLDPGLTPIPDETESIILNIDYAFGEQAGEIMRNLLLLFGKNIGSINILGKTGSLVGSRGDILLPTAFVEQSEDLFLPVENRALKRINRLQKRLPGRKIYKGPMLTVAGTLFQNRMMLSFYRHMWDSIGLEMEGVYYLRQIVEARQHSLIPEEIPMNFYYYVSDLPAAKGNQLSMKMALSEGIPPLYAVTREVLSDIFTIEAEGKS